MQTCCPIHCVVKTSAWGFLQKWRSITTHYNTHTTTHTAENLPFWFKQKKKSVCCFLRLSERSCGLMTTLKESIKNKRDTLQTYKNAGEAAQWRSWSFFHSCFMNTEVRQSWSLCRNLLKELNFLWRKQPNTGKQRLTLFWFELKEDFKKLQQLILRRICLMVPGVPQEQRSYGLKHGVKVQIRVSEDTSTSEPRHRRFSEWWWES